MEEVIIDGIRIKRFSIGIAFRKSNAASFSDRDMRIVFFPGPAVL